jgi:hypothetical protein
MDFGPSFFWVSYIYFDLSLLTDELLKSMASHNKINTYPIDKTAYLKVEKSTTSCGLRLSYHQAVYKIKTLVF